MIHFKWLMQSLTMCMSRNLEPRKSWWSMRVKTHKKNFHSTWHSCFSVYTPTKKNLERKRGTQYYARDENENVQRGELVYVSCCWENSPFAQTHSLTVHSRPNTTKSLQQIITLITFELSWCARLGRGERERAKDEKKIGGGVVSWQAEEGIHEQEMQWKENEEKLSGLIVTMCECAPSLKPSHCECECDEGFYGSFESIPTFSPSKFTCSF